MQLRWPEVVGARPTLFLAAVFLLVNATRAAYLFSWAKSSGTYAFLSYLIEALAVARWIAQDRRRQGHQPVQDEGFFVYVTSWPLALAYYLLMSRGLRGGLALLSLALFFALTCVLGAVIPFAVWYLSR